MAPAVTERGPPVGGRGPRGCVRLSMSNTLSLEVMDTVEGPRASRRGRPSAANPAEVVTRGCSVPLVEGQLGKVEFCMLHGEGVASVSAHLHQAPQLPLRLGIT